MAAYLIDTGVLLRLFDASDPQCSQIRQSLRKLRRDGHSLYAGYQNIAEFWNVSTRPSSARSGYGHSVQITERRVSFIESFGRIVPENEASYHHWKRIAKTHGVKGVSVHDARLVALMYAMQIKNLVTLNPGDFQRYSNIVVLLPADV